MVNMKRSNAEDHCICGKRVTAHFDAQGRFTRCPVIRKRDVPPTATVLVEALRRIYALAQRRQQKHEGPRDAA